jgi:hypothetical protein
MEMSSSTARLTGVWRLLTASGIVCVFSLAVLRLSGPIEGVYQGGDLAYPWSAGDAWSQLISTLNPWGTFSFATGFYTADNSSWILPLLRYLTLNIIDQAALVQRIELIFLTGLAGTSMFLYALKLNRTQFVAAAFGVIYASSPVIFNYFVIGWNNLVLTYASVPLICLLIISNKSARVLSWLGIGLLAGVLFMGSAAIPALLAVLIVSMHQRSLLLGRQSRPLFTTAVLVMGFAIANFFWVFPRLLYSPVDDKNGLSTLATSTISTGARSFFWLESPLNGNYFQYNNSFFAVYPVELRVALFVLPLLALASLLSQQTRDRSKSLIGLLTLVVLFTSIVDISGLFGPLSLIIGREPGRLFALLFFFYCLLASDYVDRGIRSVATSTTSMLLRKSAIIGLMILLGLPFWLGKLEHFPLPPQPALTLRPSPVPSEFGEISALLRSGGVNTSQTVLFFPGAASYRILDSRNRFEPSFNTVASVGIHLHKPSTWWYSDKISENARSRIERRGQLLTSGSVNDILDLMKSEGSSLVVVDRYGLTPGDVASVLAIESSSFFSELTVPWDQDELGERRFRVFKAESRVWDFGSPIANLSDSGQDDILTTMSWTNQYFLGSKANPIGSTTQLCFASPAEMSGLAVELVSSFSKYIDVSIYRIPADERCRDHKNPKGQINFSARESATGQLLLDLDQEGLASGVVIVTSFRPAILQETLLFLTFGLICFFVLLTIGMFLFHRSVRPRRLGKIATPGSVPTD